MDEFNVMNPEKFRDLGFLQEANRLFFHPRGVALAAVEGEDGKLSHFIVYDYTDDPEGVVFGDVMGRSMAQRVDKLYQDKLPFRKRLTGNAAGIQDVDCPITREQIEAINASRSNTFVLWSQGLVIGEFLLQQTGFFNGRTLTCRGVFTNPARVREFIDDVQTPINLNSTIGAWELHEYKNPADEYDPSNAAYVFERLDVTFDVTELVLAKKDEPFEAEFIFSQLRRMSMKYTRKGAWPPGPR